MASYAPNFTARLKLAYSTIGANYTQTWRAGTTVAFSTIVPLIADLHTALGALLSADFTFNSAEVSEPGADFFLPTDLDTLATLVTTGSAFPEDVKEFRCVALQFVGKTTIGQPWRVNVFGALTAPFNTIATSLSDDFRISAADSAAVTGAIAALENMVNEGLCGNDGNPIVFRPYANIVISRYRVNRIRRFG